MSYYNSDFMSDFITQEDSDLVSESDDFDSDNQDSDDQDPDIVNINRKF